MEGEQVHIRKADQRDIELLAKLGSETFYESFASQNTKEDMEKYLEERFNTGTIENELKDKLTVFFVAYLEEFLLGIQNYGRIKFP